MAFIVAIPALLAALVAWRCSVQKAFLDVYLPALLLLPDYYRWVLPGLPDPTFSQAAILPIVAFHLLSHSRRWRFSCTDLLVLGFAFCVAWSEYLNAGYSDAQNLMFATLAEIVFPYILAKALIEPGQFRVAFARRFSFLLFLVAVIAWYEFRFSISPFQNLLAPAFPDQGGGWVTTFRYGFPRIAGPFGHAILAGMLLVVGYRIHRWLEWSHLWERNFHLLPGLPVSKARIMTFFLLVAIGMTLARGPWVGGITAAVIVALGRARNRRRAYVSLAASVGFVGIPAAIGIYSYASVGRENAQSVSQESAAYRKELIVKYLTIAEEKEAWGWGTNGWPKVPGMPSIDNYYLLLALSHGFIASALLLTILVSLTGRLLVDGLRGPPAVPPGSSLSFTLAGILIAITITLFTVFMGTTAVPVFALVVGWSEGYLVYRRKSPAQVQAMLQPFTLPRFRRVVA